MQELTVLYDDDCGFCKWSLNRLLARDRDHRLRPVALQSEEGRQLIESAGIDSPMDSWHVVLPGGEVRSGGAAGPVVARAVSGGALPARLMERFPRTTDRAYRFVARNRNKFSRVLGIDATCQVNR